MICWLACLSKYMILADFVLYVWVRLGWRSAGEDSLGLGTQLWWQLASKGGQTGSSRPADIQPMPWEQGQRKKQTESTNGAYGWRYRKPKAWTRRHVPSKLISSSRNHGRVSPKWEASGRGRRKNWERKPWESIWGSTVVRKDNPEGKWRGQKWRDAKKKKKRGTRELPTIWQLLSKRGSCDRNTSAFWST